MKKESKRTVCDFLTSWVDPKTDDYYDFDLDYSDVEQKTKELSKAVKAMKNHGYTSISFHIEKEYGYYNDYSIKIGVNAYREETDKEEADRKEKEKKQLDENRARELSQLEALKKKYEA